MKYYYKTHIPCHLCELPIPDWIGRTHHPLSGTIDHITPKSLGGKDRGENREPAHAACNHHRGSNEITPRLKQECLNLIVAEFAWIAAQIPDTARYKRVRRLIKSFQKRNDPTKTQAVKQESPLPCAAEETARENAQPTEADREIAGGAE